MLKSICGLAIVAIVACASFSLAQPPGGRGPRRGGNPDDVVAASVARMMAFDADQDGKLSKAEVTDARLAALFERADADKDDVVTKDELTALFKQEAASLRSGGPGGPGGFGGPPGGFGGRGAGGPDGDRGPGGPGADRRPGGPDGDRDRGGPNGFGPPGGNPGGPPRPGEVLPRFLQDELQLTRRQRAQLEKLQADVDARLAKILTDEQREQLAELCDRGPGRPGGADRPGGPGRPGGPPPDDRGDVRPPRGDRRPPPREE